MVDKIVRDRKSVQFILRAGLAIAILLMAIGVAMKCAEGSWDMPEVRLFDLFKNPAQVGSAGDRAIAYGILVLSATPAFRVLALLVLWIRERDWKFAAVAAFVIAVLAVAVAMGGG